MITKLNNHDYLDATTHRPFVDDVNDYAQRDVW